MVDLDTTLRPLLSPGPAIRGVLLACDLSGVFPLSLRHQGDEVQRCTGCLLQKRLPSLPLEQP
jgi:hypothetical protein